MLENSEIRKLFIKSMSDRSLVYLFECGLEPILSKADGIQAPISPEHIAEEMNRRWFPEYLDKDFDGDGIVKEFLLQGIENVKTRTFHGQAIATKFPREFLVKMYPSGESLLKAFHEEDQIANTFLWYNAGKKNYDSEEIMKLKSNFRNF